MKGPIRSLFHFEPRRLLFAAIMIVIANQLPAAWFAQEWVRLMRSHYSRRAHACLANSVFK